jgi:hypothetical protein
MAASEDAGAGFVAGSADGSVCDADCVDCGAGAESDFSVPASGGAVCGLAALALPVKAVRERSGGVTVENSVEDLARSCRCVDDEFAVAEPLASAGGTEWLATDGCDNSSEFPGELTGELTGADGSSSTAPSASDAVLANAEGRRIDPLRIGAPVVETFDDAVAGAPTDGGVGGVAIGDVATIDVAEIGVAAIEADACSDVAEAEVFAGAGVDFTGNCAAADCTGKAMAGGSGGINAVGKDDGAAKAARDFAGFAFFAALAAAGELGRAVVEVAGTGSALLESSRMARTSLANVGDVADAPVKESAGEKKFAALAEAEDEDSVADLEADGAADCVTDFATVCETGGAACSDKAFGMAMGSMLGGEPPGRVDASGSPI